MLTKTQTFSLDVEECAPCQLAAELPVAGSFATPTAPQERALWEGVIGMEAQMTGDGRLIENGALRWEVSEETPAPMRYVSQDVGAHDGAVVVGRILSIERRDGGVIWARGDFDLGSEAGREAHRVVSEGITNGVSMDLDDVSFEIRVAADLLETMDPESEQEEPDADGLVKVLEMHSDDEVRVTTDGRIRAATIVAIPAFAEARIAVVTDADEDEEEAPEEETAPAEEEEDEELGKSLTASAAPLHPPAAWFENPGLLEPTALTVTDEGRVFGHLALWGTCHTGHATGGQCVTPPANTSGYAGFLTGAVRTAEGHEVAVGRITLGTGHADLKLSSAQASRHYDNTGSAVADIVTGEDTHGIWFSGALRPDVTPEQLRVLRSSPVSGDWRMQGSGMELVAVLAVNVPGFPVPRPSGQVRDGRVRSLVASGMVPPRRVPAPGSANALSVSDLKYLKRLAARERRETISRIDALARARRLATMREKVHAFAATRAQTD